MLVQPPASRDRSFNASKPRWPGRRSRSETTNPRPLSMTSPWIAPSVDLTVTWTRVAAACLSTFVSASDTCLKTIDETRKLERNRLKWLEQLPNTRPPLAATFHRHHPPPAA